MVESANFLLKRHRGVVRVLGCVFHADEDLVEVVYWCWVVAPEVLEGGVVEDVAVCGVGDEEFKGRVTRAYDCDQAGHDG